MNLDQLVIELRAKTDQFDASIKRVDGQVSSLTQNVERQTQRIGQGFLQLAKYAAAGFSVDSIIRAGREMQGLDARLKATTGSAAAAAQAMGLLREMAARQSVDVMDLADGFNRLLPSVKSGIVSFEDMRRILELANDNVKAFGLSAGESQGLFLGLSQALGSGTVTMEDLRQVTDRLPGTLNAMAESMNMSVGQLKAFIATGQATTRDVLPALIDALDNNAGAAESMGNTFDSAMTRAQNAFRDFAALITDSGLFDLLVSGFDQVANAMVVASAVVLKYRLMFNELQGDTDELNRLQDRYNDILGQLSGNAEVATDKLAALQGKGDSGLTGAGKAANDAAKNTAKLAEALRKMGRDANAEMFAMHMSDAEKAAYDFDDAIEELTRRYGPLNAQQERYVKLLRQQKIETATMKEAKKAAEDAAEELKRQNERIAEAMNRPFENAARGIQTALTDTFESIFNGSIDSASDAADAIKRVFIRMAAEMATLQIFGPQLMGLSGGGFFGGGMTSAGRSAGGMGGLSNLSNLTSLSGIMNGLNTPFFSAGSGIGGALNGVGNFFGLSGPMAQGPTLSGAAGYGAGISANFTPMSALAAFGGNFLGNAIFGGGRYSSVGGTAGGVLGTAIGGPVGGFVGSLLGNGIGGMFGPGRAHPASTFQTAGTDFSNLNLLSKHMDNSYASGLAGGLQQALAALSGAGLDLSFIRQIQGGTDDGTGFLSLGQWRNRRAGETVTFNPNNADAGLAQFLKLVVDAAGDLSGIMDAELIPALKNLSTAGKTSAQVLNEIVTALTRDDLRKALMESVDASIMELALPGFNALRQAEQEYNATMARARELGVSEGGLNRITALYQANISRLREQNDPFAGFLASIRTGQYSPLTPTANLDQMRAQVRSAGERAGRGEIGARDELARLLPQFVELSGSVNGFNSAFEADRQLSETLAVNAQSLASRGVELQEAILKQAEMQTDIFTRAFGGSAAMSMPSFNIPDAVTAANDNRVELAALRQDIQTLIRVTAASGQLTSDQLAQLNAVTERMSRNGELRWA